MLVGGGHSHVLALRMLGMNPPPGVRITLVSAATDSPYSGMLPGLLAGHYTEEEIHIDLRRLCAWAGARFVRCEVTGLDLEGQTVLFGGERPALRWDVLSLDVGSAPDSSLVADVTGVSAVKPIASFYQRWLAWHEELNGGTQLRLAIVGGGVGSVEIALAARHWITANRPDSTVDISLISSSSKLLEEYSNTARRLAIDALHHASIQVIPDSRIIAAKRLDCTVELSTAEGVSREFDRVFWCTAAAAPAWPAAAGLSCDDRGFVKVNAQLQSISHPQIFAAGDIAHMVDSPRPKAGVFAVRQGPVLANNLAAYCTGSPLQRYRPQRQYLSLLATGDKGAVANWRMFGVAGYWVWRWKDRIDREFMNQFQDLSAMQMEPGRYDNGSDDAMNMHCGGCAAKLAADPLQAALHKLRKDYPTVGFDPVQGDDAVAIGGDGKVILQSVDVLRELVSDPYTQGRIAANHALSDLHAMGAQASSAQAIIQLGYASAEIQTGDLYQLLAGALREFAAVNCPLVGGHTLEGTEPSIGFVVNGSVDGNTVLRKQGAQAGDALILTKPLGTGVLFAAHMQLALNSRHLNAAEAMMLQSNSAAATIAVEENCSAATDVTGFGLAGHLLEMLSSADLNAKLNLAAVPVLPGVCESFSRGLYSTAHAANAIAAGQIELASGVDSNRVAVLYDPQTSGGLLLAIKPEAVGGCLERLRDAGYTQAADIGRFKAGSGMILAAD